MVGKNNNIRMIKANSKEHYKSYKAGTYWIYASLASLALGAGLLLSTGMVASADTATTTISETTQKTTDSTAKAVTPTASANGDSSDAVNSNNNTAPSTNESANINAKNGSTASASSDSGTDMTQATSDAARNGTTPTAGNISTTSSANQSNESKTLVNPTEEQLAAAKTSAEQVYKATQQPQEIHAVAGDPATVGTGALTISANAVGYGTNAKSPLTLTLKASAKAGDVYQITIPADTPVYTFNQIFPLSGGDGTTVTTLNADGSHTLTDTFDKTVSATQQIQLTLGDNFAPQTTVMSDVGKTVAKTITFSINGVDQKPIKFTQLIKPTTNLTSVSLIHPDSQIVKKLLPDNNYVFAVSVNEADGVVDDSWPTPRVNSADNFGGSKITIPVPTGFVLDTADTGKVNGITDGTTITQPGGLGTNVIIAVPAGAGNQGHEQDVAPYKLVGSFHVNQTNTDQTFTAKGNVTLSQIMNSDGNILTDSAAPWSVTILADEGGTDPGASAAQAFAKGNSSIASDKLVLDADPSTEPAYLNSLGFGFDTAAEAKNAKITVTIPDGLDATSIKTPAQGITKSAYLPDTNSYNYTLTLADNKTETGTVKAGAQITPKDKSAIRTAVFIPNKVAPGSYTDGTDPIASFTVQGHLASKYDKGSLVKIGDALSSTVKTSFDVNGRTLEKSASAVQKVVEAQALAQAFLWSRTNSSSPGNPSAGTLQIRYSDPFGQTTNKIYEPTFYFVIPKPTTVVSINSLNWFSDDPVSDSSYVKDPTGAELTKVTGAKVSEFTADNGQKVVKIDYAGTGKNVDVSQVTGHWGGVTLANNPDALPGNYPYSIYVVSPKTKLLNTKAVPTTDPNFNAKTDAPLDPSFVENKQNVYLMGGENGTGNWNISTASAFFNTSLAMGNSNIDAVTEGKSDDKGSSKLTFYDAIVYTSAENNAQNHDAATVINLPTAGDSKGSQYTFNLTGAITVPKNYTTSTGAGDLINPVVLYSTAPQKFNATDTAPNTTGYVTADKVSDWSAIRSIIVQVKGIKPNTSTGRMVITGTTKDFADQAGKTGYLQTAFYGDGVKVNVNNKDASIEIVGTSTLNARYHYKDAAGHDQYIALPDLAQTLNNNVDKIKDIYPKQSTDFSKADQQLIPTGYKLVTDTNGKTVTPIVIDGTGDNPKGSQTKIGDVVHRYNDGDFVQYELVGNTSLTVTYIDRDNHDATVGTPETITDTIGKTGNYIVTLPAHYVFADLKQATTIPYTLKTDTSDNIVIPLKHVHATTNVTTNRLITYTGVANNKNPKDVNQPLKWSVDTDQVNGVTTYTPTGAYAEVTTPTVAGYTPNKAKVSAGVDTVTTVKPVDSKVTVIYTPDRQSTIVEYVDDDNNEEVVGTPWTLSGVTDGTADWNTKNKPLHYSLAAGQAANGTYTFKADHNLPVIIHLNHKIDYSTVTSTRTIHYVIDNPNYAGKVPATQVQTVTWKVSTDEVTGESVATPQGAYYEVTSPNIPGYVANPSKVGQQALGSVVARDVPMYNEDVVVTYTAISQNVPSNGENVPGNPTDTPTNTPTTPTGTPTDTPANTPIPGKVVTNTSVPKTAKSRTEVKKGKNTAKISEAGKSVGNAKIVRASISVKPASVKEASTSNHQQRLPQTNEQIDPETILGILGMLTLVGLKRRKRRDE